MGCPTYLHVFLIKFIFYSWPHTHSEHIHGILAWMKINVHYDDNKLARFIYSWNWHLAVKLHVFPVISLTFSNDHKFCHTFVWFIHGGLHLSLLMHEYHEHCLRMLHILSPLSTTGGRFLLYTKGFRSFASRKEMVAMIIQPWNKLSVSQHKKWTLTWTDVIDQ